MLQYNLHPDPASKPATRTIASRFPDEPFPGRSMRRFTTATVLIAFVVLCIAAGATPGAAESPRVVVTIKPAHSLAAAVMRGVAEPHLLIEGSGSPHGQALKPSQASRLQEAEAVIRVSEALETFLNRSIANLAGDARVITLDETPGLTLHETRQGGPWQRRGHEEQEEPGEAGHEHRVPAGGADGRDGRDPHASHAHGGHDPHLWLDPHNARKLAGRIAAALSEIWPEHESAFKANAARLRERLAALDAEIAGRLAPLKDTPYIVFHDAYRYFEERYGLSPAGSVTVAPDRLPGAWRVAQIRERIERAGATCVFVEPQFEPRLVATLTEGTPARRGVLDPLGARLEPGAELYFSLMRNLAAGLAECLAPA